MSEKTVENQIKAHIKKYPMSKGNVCFKIWGSGLTVSGIPDLIGMYNPSGERGKGCAFFAEVKKPKGGTLSAKQRIYLSAFAYGGNCVVGTVRSLDEFLELFNA